MGLWTQDEEMQLRALVASRPKLSSSEIGRRLGRSRDSVIGYCHRIGLALPRAAKKASPIRRKPTAPKQVTRKSRPKHQTSKLRVFRFADLAANQCRFPVADDQPGPLMACCGNTVAEPFAAIALRSSYCAQCLKMITR